MKQETSPQYGGARRNAMPLNSTTLLIFFTRDIWRHIWDCVRLNAKKPKRSKTNGKLWATHQLVDAVVFWVLWLLLQREWRHHQQTVTIIEMGENCLPANLLLNGSAVCLCIQMLTGSTDWIRPNPDQDLVCLFLSFWPWKMKMLSKLDCCHWVTRSAIAFSSYPVSWRTFLFSGHLTFKATFMTYPVRVQVIL